MILSTTHIPSFWIPLGWCDEFLGGEFGAFALNGYPDINGFQACFVGFCCTGIHVDGNLIAHCGGVLFQYSIYSIGYKLSRCSTTGQVMPLLGVHLEVHFSETLANHFLGFR